MKRSNTPLGTIVAFLGSFELACVLLLCLFLLTLFGTLEQTETGLYEVQKAYFESWFVVHRQALPGLDFRLPIPLPGALPVMALFTLNLLIGGLVRIRKSSRTLGIIIVHIGIALMMAAGLVKLVASHDGHLTLAEGEQASEFVSYYDWEIAVWPLPAGDAGGEPKVEHLVLHENLAAVRSGGRTLVDSADLPFTFVLSDFERNARPVPKGPMFEAPHRVIDGWTLLPEKPDPTAERNVAGLYVDVRPRDGSPALAGFLFGGEGLPWTFEADGRAWAMTLRHARFPMPYTIRLDKFTRELHPRTGIAKVFSSRVAKIEDGAETEIAISMNEPLRDGGLVLFQSSWGETPRGLFSVFSVVRNPSDHWPLYSCIIIAAGLLLAFGQRLLAHVRTQRKKLARLRAATDPGS